VRIPFDLEAGQPVNREYQRTIALIGGTGLVFGTRRIPLDEARVHNDVTVTFGADSGRILHYVEGYHGRTRVILLPRHGPTPERPDRSPAALVKEKGHEAHVWLLHKIGVSAVFAFSAVGALDLDVPLASEMSFVVPHEYGRGLGATVHSFGNLAKTIHPGMREPFSPALRSQAKRAIEAAGAVALSNGIYIYSGPDQFETDAEVRATRRLYEGEAHRLVGMTAGPELVLCRQMEIPYAVICANSNYAQGLVAGAPVTHALVVDTMNAASDKLVDIASHIIRIAAEET
jgi:5'-methylthioadenosine phosphorylase